MKSNIFFDHIYKAAGTSIDRVLADRVGVDNMSPCVHEAAETALARFRNKRVITGHFFFSPNEAFDATRYYLTVLRDPVERILSHYYFARNDVPLKGANLVIDLAKKLPLEDYVLSEAAEVRSLVRNNQVRHFAPLCWDGSAALDSAALLGAAKAALDRYDLVGVVEELEDTMILLCRDHGWSIDADIPRANATSSRLSAKELEATLLRSLRDMNALDMELHGYAVQCLARKRREALRRVIGAAPGAPERCEEGGGATSPETGRAREYGNRRIEILHAAVAGIASVSHQVMAGEDVRVTVRLLAREPVAGVNVGIRISDADGQTVFGQNLRSFRRLLNVEPGQFVVEFRFRCALGYGDYSISASVYGEDPDAPQTYHWKGELAWLSVVGNIGDHFEGYVKLDSQLLLHSPTGPSGRAVAEMKEIEGGGDQHVALHAPVLTDFRSQIAIASPPSRMEPAELRAVCVELENRGTQAWPSRGMQRVCVSYHWANAAGEIVAYEGARSPLIADVPPGERLRQWATVKAPPESGTYTLLMSLLQEYVAWFDTQGSVPACIVVQVGRGPDGGLVESTGQESVRTTTE